MQNGQIEIYVQDYGWSGEGVGRIEGRVCFVPYTIVGEKVRAEIIKQNNKFFRCKPVEIITSSPLRQTPPCPYFANCGGCAFQHISYDEEIKIKKENIIKQLEKIGYKPNGYKFDVFLSPKEYGYRNKIKLFTFGDRLALCQNNSSQKVEIEKCLLVKDKINDAISKLQDFVMAKKVGRVIDNIYIKALGEELLVQIDFRSKRKVDFTGLQIMLGAKAGIYISVKGENLQHISGIKEIKTQEFGLDCEFGVNSFHQVNDFVSEELYKTVLSLIKGQSVINAYSGAGILSGIISKSGKTCFGIELGEQEHSEAEKLKDKNKLTKLYNIQGDCAQKISSYIMRDMQTIIVDPPRAGCDKSVINAINASRISRLIYISCDIASASRDISHLEGFAISTVKMFDMFPRTSSTEVLFVLDRKSV